MKRILLMIAAAGALSLTSGAAAAGKRERCTIGYTLSKGLLKKLDSDGFAFDSYNSFCPWLRQHGLKLDIAGQQGTIGSKAYGTIMVRLMRRDSGIASPVYTVTTSFATPATNREAEAAAYDAAMSSIEALATERDSHLKRLRQEERRLAAWFAAKARR